MNIIKNYTSNYNSEYHITRDSPKEIAQQSQEKSKNNHSYAVCKLVARYLDNQEFLKNTLTNKQFNKVAFTDPYIKRFHNVKAIKNLLAESEKLIKNQNSERKAKVLETIERLKIDAQLKENSLPNTSQKQSPVELDYNKLLHIGTEGYFDNLYRHLFSLHTHEMSISESTYAIINSDLMQIKKREIQWAEDSLLQEIEMNVYFYKVVALLFDREYSCSQILDIIKKDYEKYSNKQSDELFKNPYFSSLYLATVILRTPFLKEDEKLLEVIDTDRKKIPIESLKTHGHQLLWHMVSEVVYMNSLMLTKDQEKAEMLVNQMHEHHNSIVQLFPDKGLQLNVLGEIAQLRGYIATSSQEVILFFKQFNLDLSKLICAPLQQVTIEDNEEQHALQKAQYNNSICKALLHNLHVEGYSNKSILTRDRKD